MRETSYLSLQANIICLLLALIGSTAIIKHPEWFGSPPDTATAATPTTLAPSLWDN